MSNVNRFYTSAVNTTCLKPGALVGPLCAACVLTVLLAAGCAPVTTAPEPLPESIVEAPAEDGVVQVYPLTGPEASVLLDQARAARADGDLDLARELTMRALELTPQDPQMWQLLAELALQSGAYQAAVDHARHAFEIGPQVGAICTRSWRTMGHAQARLGLTEAAEQASRRAQMCAVQAAPRL